MRPALVLLISWFLPALTVFAAFAATDEPVSCPASIAVTQDAPADSEAWEHMNTRQGQPHRLRATSFYNGHPKHLGELKPSQIDAPAPGVYKPLVHTYDFSERYADGVWLVCRYDLTSVIAFKRLLKVPASCEITYTRKPHPAPVLTMHCR